MQMGLQIANIALIAGVFQQAAKNGLTRGMVSMSERVVAWIKA